MDFGTLKDDKEIQDKLINFQNSITKIEQVLEESLVENVHEQLSTKEKIDFDLFTAYSLNTLYWLYLRSSGEDPNKNDVKNQLNRVKEYMTKAKQAHERNTIRPRLNQPAANRFIKHGIKRYEENRGNQNHSKRQKKN